MTFMMTVLLIWGSMHLYAWVRIRAYSGLGATWASWLAIAFLVLMVSPIIGIRLARAGHWTAGRAVGTVGMVWSGAFFLFFSMSLAHDAYNGLMTLGGFALPVLNGWRLLGARPIIAEAAAVLAICVYGAFEARTVLTQHVTLPTTKLPPDTQRVRIVQISDVHLGLSIGPGHLKRILRRVRESDPDIFVCTGDLVDAHMSGKDLMAELLAGIEAPMGKYACTGNHEYYAGLAQALAFTREAGFTVLSGEAARPCEGLSIVGVDDATGGESYFGGGEMRSEAAVLGQAHDGDFVVLLKHRPVVEDGSASLMDLQLSGHTHGGQIFPFHLIVARVYRFYSGLVDAGGAQLYTSRGSGLWGPPIRFLAPAEVTVIDIVRAEG